MATQSQRQVAYRDFIPRDEMACPICQSSCSSLQQLNQHLDDVHSTDQSEEKSAVLSWLRRAHIRITKEMSIKSSSDALQRSFSGIPQIASGVQQQISQTMQDGSLVFMEQSGEGVTREHWQRERGDGRDVCESAGCRKVLGRLGTGRSHCRKCGMMYCDAHTQHQMRLSLAAQHDPESGIWCRVCEACFVTREGYMDLDGVTRNRTRDFVKLRKKTLERVHLIENRLEKRMEKLAKVYAVQEKLSSSTQSSLLSFGDKYREQEKSVTKWEDDTSVLRCPFCAQEFKRMTLRKHHCRLCGRVVCAKQSCSSLVPLFLDMSAELYDQEPVGEARACWDCRNSVFRRKEHAEVMARPPPAVKLYTQLMDIQKAIEAALPKFHEMVTLLEENKALPQTHPNYRRAAQTRKDLLELFAKFDAISKKIAAIPTKRADHLRLHKAIHTSASQYLHKNMLPLQMLPKILRPSLPSNNDTAMPSSLDIPDIDPIVREQITILQEQHDIVSGYLQEAQKKRKFEDARSLKANLDALGEEIAQLKAET